MFLFFVFCVLPILLMCSCSCNVVHLTCFYSLRVDVKTLDALDLYLEGGLFEYLQGHPVS
jgi:hypothetical protein